MKNATFTFLISLSLFGLSTEADAKRGDHPVHGDDHPVHGNNHPGHSNKHNDDRYDRDDNGICIDGSGDKVSGDFCFDI